MTELTLQSLSRKAISRIVNRANKGCSLCHWKKAHCDIHHIIQRSEGGSDDPSNLIVLCPNCHRLAHSNKIKLQRLLQNSILTVYQDWKDHYKG